MFLTNIALLKGGDCSSHPAQYHEINSCQSLPLPTHSELPLGRSTVRRNVSRRIAQLGWRHRQISREWVQGSCNRVGKIAHRSVGSPSSVIQGRAALQGLMVIDPTSVAMHLREIVGLGPVERHLTAKGRLSSGDGRRRKLGGSRWDL